MPAKKLSANREDESVMVYGAKPSMVIYDREVFRNDELICVFLEFVLICALKV